MNFFDNFARGVSQGQNFRQNRNILAGQEQQQQQQAQQFEAQQAQAAQKQQILARVFGGGQQATPQQQIASGQTQGINPAAQPVSATQQQPSVNTGQPQDLQAWAQLAVQFPDEFEKINQNFGLISQGQKDQAANFAFDLENTPFEQRKGKIEQRARTLAAQGRDHKDTLSLIGQSEQEQNSNLQATQIATLSPEKRQEIAQQGIENQFKERGLDGDDQDRDLRRENQAFKQQIDTAQLAQGDRRINETILNNRANREDRQSVRAQEQQEKEQERQAATEQAEGLQRTQQANSQRVIGIVDETLGLVNGAGSFEQSIGKRLFPQGEGGQLSRNIDVLRSNLGLDQLIAIKAQGGTLGALNETEFNALTNKITNLSTTQSPKQLEKSLNEIKTFYQQSLGGNSGDPELGSGGTFQSPNGVTFSVK